MPKYRHLSAEEFRRHAVGGEFKHGVPDDVCVIKTAVCEVKQIGDESERKLGFVISDAGIDRDGDTISIDGWDLSNYRKNPVVLWAHDYRQPPIGRAVELSIQDGKLRAVDEFMGAEMSQFADRIYQMYKGGWLSATSVGFLPRKWNYAESEERKYGIDFAEQEMLEHSCVPVPSNPRALIEARGADVDLGPLKSWATDVLAVCLALEPAQELTHMREQLAIAIAQRDEALAAGEASRKEIERLNARVLSMTQKDLSFRKR